jgi:uncharacterized protein YbjT (DUF2867 family)
MKYVITGGAGHVSKPLTEKLLSAGHEVTLISRSEKNIAGLTAKGAKAAIGSVEDVDFLTKVFTGADAVYTMVPPNMAASNWKKFIAETGNTYAKAIKASGVKYVVNLSSVGAHLPENCGPVSGLYHVEKVLDEITGVNIKHLRAAYFYTNLLANIDMVRNLGIIGGNFGGPDLQIPIVDPSDIAEAAAQELVTLDFSGHSYRYIASDENTSDEIAKVLGSTVGKPDLKWIVFTDEDALKGMLQAGLPEEIAKNFVEMNHSLHTGEMYSDYWENHPHSFGKIKLEDFAKVFASVYNSNEVAKAH